MPAGREGPRGAAPCVTLLVSPCCTPALPVVPPHPLNKAGLLLCPPCARPAASPTEGPRPRERRSRLLQQTREEGACPRHGGGHRRGPREVGTAAPHAGRHKGTEVRSLGLERSEITLPAGPRSFHGLQGRILLASPSSWHSLAGSGLSAGPAASSRGPGCVCVRTRVLQGQWPGDSVILSQCGLVSTRPRPQRPSS